MNFEKAYRRDGVFTQETKGHGTIREGLEFSFFCSLCCDSQSFTALISVSGSNLRSHCVFSQVPAQKREGDSGAGTVVSTLLGLLRAK